MPELPSTADMPARPIGRAAVDKFLPARTVWERYDVTSMSLYRWLADQTLNFPQPVYIGRFRYWKLSELEEWERSRPRAPEERSKSSLRNATSAALDTTSNAQTRAKTPPSQQSHPIIKPANGEVR